MIWPLKRPNDNHDLRGRMHMWILKLDAYSPHRLCACTDCSEWIQSPAVKLRDFVELKTLGVTLFKLRLKIVLSREVGRFGCNSGVGVSRNEEEGVSRNVEVGVSRNVEVGVCTQQLFWLARDSKALPMQLKTHSYR